MFYVFSMRRAQCCVHKMIEELDSYVSDLCLDSVECVPDEEISVFACGNYELLKEEAPEGNGKQTKIGKIQLFAVDKESEKLEILQHLETCAVLDMKWKKKPLESSGKRYLLGMAGENGFLETFLFKRNEYPGFGYKGQLYNFERVDLNFFDSTNSLALSMDWNDRGNQNEERCVVSMSDGSLCLVYLQNREFVLGNKWLAHENEAWIAAFDCWNTELLFSGSDDCTFKGWDLRCLSPIFINRNSHKAGVTSIQSSPKWEHVLLTGSYDEYVRVWDNRMLGIPQHEVKVEGGVWRIKWNDLEGFENLVAVACMHGGSKILKFQEIANWLFKNGEFNKHESLVYGIDWIPSISSRGNHYGVSCSFYDHSLRLWKLSKE